MSELNALEKDIIQWLIDNELELAISGIVEELEVSERKATNRGFFTSLLPHRAYKGLQLCEAQGYGHIAGPDIVSSSLSHGAATEVYFENGQINCIEAYSIADGSAYEISDYELIDPNINYINDLN